MQIAGGIINSKGYIEIKIIIVYTYDIAATKRPLSIVERLFLGKMKYQKK